MLVVGFILDVRVGVRGYCFVLGLDIMVTG